MELTAGTVTEQKNGFIEEHNLFIYSEAEKQQQEINESNSSHIFTPEFIPFYPKVKSDYNLSDTATLLYGFIRFYLANSSKRFYFTNEQLSEMLVVSEKTVSLAIKDLNEKSLIKAGYKIKAGGGQIRFIAEVKKFPDLTISTSLTLQNVKSVVTKSNGNNNKIKENKINIESSKYIERYNSLFKSTARVTDGRNSKLKARLKTFTYEEIITALENMAQIPWYTGKNDTKWVASPDFLLRNDEQIDRFLNNVPKKSGLKYATVN